MNEIQEEGCEGVIYDFENQVLLLVPLMNEFFARDIYMVSKLKPDTFSPMHNPGPFLLLLGVLSIQR